MIIRPGRQKMQLRHSGDYHLPHYCRSLHLASLYLRSVTHQNVQKGTYHRRASLCTSFFTSVTWPPLHKNAVLNFWSNETNTMPATFHYTNIFQLKQVTNPRENIKKVSSFFYGASARFQAMASSLPGFRDNCRTRWRCQSHAKPLTWSARVTLFARHLA